MKKKAQMEIMGLAVIVIILALAMLFVVQFIVLREASETKKTFTHKKQAVNTVETMLSTTTDCKDMQIKHLLMDCAEAGFIQCPEENSPERNSCSYAKEVIQEILDNTLIQWNKEFYFTIRVDDEDVIDPFGSPCPKERVSSSPCCPLNTGAGQMVMSLYICS